MGDRGRRPVPCCGRVPAALGRSRRRAAGGCGAGHSGRAAVVDGATAGRMSVTVVVASRNRRADLLASLPRHEAPVILVDNGSTDGTVAAVGSALPAVQIIAAGSECRRAGPDGRRAGGHDAVRGVRGRRQLVGAGRARPGGRGARGAPGGRAGDRPDPARAGRADRSADRGDGGGAAGHVAGRGRGRTCSASQPARRWFGDRHSCRSGGFDRVVRFPGEEERVALDLADAGWLLSYVDDLVVHHHPSPSRGSVAHRRTRSSAPRC